MNILEALAFQELYQKIKNDRISFKTAYKFNKINLALLPDIEFYQENIQKILDNYAEKDEDGNFKSNEENSGVMIKEEKIEQCHKEINDLQSIDVEISDIVFTMDELEGLKITPLELSSLMPLIKD